MNMLKNAWKNYKVDPVKIVLFFGLGLFFSHLEFTKILGSDISFTVFDFFGPVLGAFLGIFGGVFVALAIGLSNLALDVYQGQSIELASVIRLMPVLFGVVYFGMKKADLSSKIFLAIPAVCMVLFWLHPEGREAWFYALYWLVPLLAYPFKNHVYANALGSTFTIHAIGGVAWLYAFNLPAEVWTTLIPIVALERFVFATGIAGTYLSVEKISDHVRKVAEKWSQKEVKETS